MNIQNESRNASVPGFFNQIDMQRLDILVLRLVPHVSGNIPESCDAYPSKKAAS